MKKIIFLILYIMSLLMTSCTPMEVVTPSQVYTPTIVYRTMPRVHVVAPPPPVRYFVPQKHYYAPLRGRQPIQHRSKFHRH